MKRSLLRVVVIFLTIGVLSFVAYATHFRYGHYTWVQGDGNTVEFTLQNAFKRAGGSTRYRCIDPETLGIVPCSGPDGAPGVGDVFEETIGLTLFFPGDGTSIGSPLGALLYVVTSIDPVNNWLFALALDPASLPEIDTTISHSYPTDGGFLAFTESCCRISALLFPNAHINNPDGPYRVETLVPVGSGDSPPVSVMPPIVLCPQEGLCSFFIPTTDPDGDTLRFRLATSREASGSSFIGFTQPGPPDAPNAASIDPDTGLYTWDTTGATLGPPDFNTLYSTQVVIEELTSGGSVKGKVSVDFFIQLVPGAPGNAPAFSPRTPCGRELPVDAGKTIFFPVQSGDPDPGDIVTLNVVGLPAGATMNPPLPVRGNPALSTFSWTPTAADAGVRIVTFTATDATQNQTLCSVTIAVSSEAAVAVPIDIKPGSCPNPLNIDQKGVLPVAILGTADFDVTQVDAASIRLEGVAPLPSFSLEDVATPFAPFTGKADCNEDCTTAGPDGFLDLSLKFSSQKVAAALGAVQNRQCRLLKLTANLLDGTPVQGEDIMVILTNEK